MKKKFGFTMWAEKKEDGDIKEYEMNIFFKAAENNLQVLSLLLSPFKENKPKQLLGAGS